MTCVQCGRPSTRILEDTMRQQRLNFCTNCPAIPVIIQQLKPGCLYYPCYNTGLEYTSVLRLQNEWTIRLNDVTYDITRVSLSAEQITYSLVDGTRLFLLFDPRFVQYLIY
jgi:hypothetical protein